MKNDEKKMRRGIYLLPSLFTVAGLFSGFYSIVASTKGLYLPAAMWVFVAMICDGLDGRVARLTNTQSEFGSQLDSMSDMVCFGIAPALLVYLWSLSELGKVGWLSAFWFAMCSALRLARFNANTENTDKKYFKGLSTPLAAACVCSFVWCFADINFHHAGMSPLMAVFMIVLGLLMVSSIPFRSFKDLDLKNKVPFFKLMLLVLAIFFVVLDPPKTLLFYSSLYLLSGLVEWVYRFMQRRGWISVAKKRSKKAK